MLLVGEKRRYTRNKLIGAGTHSQCYIVYQQDNGAIYAAKIIPRAKLENSDLWAKTHDEIITNLSVATKNLRSIVPFERYFENDKNFCLLTKYYKLGTLEQLLDKRQKLTEPEVIIIMKQVLAGLKHLRQRKIVHRDLKLSCLYIDDDGQIRIGGFGEATTLRGDNRLTQICGTVANTPPEMLSSKNGYRFGVDIWTLGIIMCQLLTGKHPFYHKEREVLMKNIHAGYKGLPANYLSAVSPGLQKFLRNMLNPDQTHRLTI